MQLSTVVKYYIAMENPVWLYTIYIPDLGCRRGLDFHNRGLEYHHGGDQDTDQIMTKKNLPARWASFLSYDGMA